MRRLAVVLGLAVAACGSDQEATTTDQPEGFGTVAVRVTAADGGVCDLCLWLAETPDQRGRGMIGVTDLGPADGMLFEFDQPSMTSFHMREVTIPLSIGWFSDGTFVSSAEMEPCPDASPDCTVYSAAGPYTAAIETLGGGLDELGIAPGSTLAVLDEPCPPDE